MQEYLIKSSVDEAQFISASGQEFIGIALEEMVCKVVRFLTALEQASKKFYGAIAKCFAIGGLLSMEIFDLNKKDQILQSIEILNNSELNPDKTNWDLKIDQNQVEFFRAVRGLKETKTLSKGHIESLEFINLAKYAADIANLFKGLAKLIIKSQEFSIRLPRLLLSQIIKSGKYYASTF